VLDELGRPPAGAARELEHPPSRSEPPLRRQQRAARRNVDRMRRVVLTSPGPVIRHLLGEQNIELIVLHRHHTVAAVRR
jgi:hypothetical protein